MNESVLARSRLDREQLGVDPPRDVWGLEPEGQVALLLAAGERVDDVERLAGAGDIAGGELLPDEAADRQDPLATERGQLGELVVLVAEDGLDAAAGDPGAVLLGGDLEGGGLVDPRLVPDVVALEPALHRPPLLLRPRQDVGLVPELVERRAELAGHHRLAPVEPFRDEPDAHLTLRA